MTIKLAVLVPRDVEETHTLTSLDINQAAKYIPELRERKATTWFRLIYPEPMRVCSSVFTEYYCEIITPCEMQTQYRVIILPDKNGACCDPQTVNQIIKLIKKRMKILNCLVDDVVKIKPSDELGGNVIDFLGDFRPMENNKVRTIMTGKMYNSRSVCG